MGLLDRYDPLFSCEYLLRPPYPTAELLRATLSEAIAAAETYAEMTFKEQIAQDLDNILIADEISDNVTLTSGGVSTVGKAVLNVGGQSESEWRGGVCLTATAVLPKSTFPQPKPHDLLDVANGRLYSIDHITEESNVAWVVALVAEKKAK